MPFLTLQELEQHIGADDVRSVTDEVGAFQATERGIAEMIAAITGTPEPEEANAAPAWSKLPAAWLVYETLLGRMKNVSRDRLDYWARKAKEARDMIALRATRETGSAAEGEFVTGKMDNMPEW